VAKLAECPNLLILCFNVEHLLEPLARYISWTSTLIGLFQIVPATLKRQTRADTVKPRPAISRPEGSKPAEDRQSYRRAPGVGPDKKADVGAGTGEVEFVS